MLIAALRDLQWRKKRFAITLVTTALVFAMSLVMSGLAQSFPDEVDGLLVRLGGVGYLAAPGSPGPFYGSQFVPESAAPGTSPVLFNAVALPTPSGLRQVAVFGVPPGSPASPKVHDGSPLTRSDDMVADATFGYRVGDTVTVAGRPFHLVGRLSGATLFGGQPTVFITTAAAQAIFAGGQPASRSFVVPVGGSTSAPPGLEFFTRAQAKADLLRPLKSANDAITFVKVLLWIVAACIIGSVVYLTAMERTRDFAVFKATGVGTGAIGAGLLLQSVVLAVASSIVAIVLAMVLAPLFPLPVTVPRGAELALPLLAVVVGVVAGLAGLRRSASVSPAAAFGGP